MPTQVISEGFGKCVGRAGRTKNGENFRARKTGAVPCSGLVTQGEAAAEKAGLRKRDVCVQVRCYGYQPH